VERQDELLEAHPELAFEKDFLRWMLSDAAGAALVQPQPRRDGLSLRIDWIDLFSFAHELPACMYAGAEKDEDGRLRGWLTYSHEDLGARSVMALKQDVRLLNANVVEYCLIKPMQILLKRRALEAERIDWFLPHMSSQYFAGPLAAGLERAGLPIPRERWFTNLAERGNVGSAAMFVMLDDLMDSGRLKRGQHVLCFVPESGRFSSGLVHLTAV
jgi:3-oxoacyl-[acyl-carrier-protein] synthase-3